MAKLVRVLTLTAALSAWVVAYAQVSSSDRWWHYLAEYDGMPGSTRVDMAQKCTAPLSMLPNVVIVGVQYETKLPSGLPDQDELGRLKDLADTLIKSILSTGPSLYVGTFTHKRQQEHYIYVRSLADTEEAFQKAITKACPNCKPLFRTKVDPKWDTYLKFLYPNAATMEFHAYIPEACSRVPRMTPNPSLHPTAYSGLRPLPSAGELKR